MSWLRFSVVGKKEALTIFTIKIRWAVVCLIGERGQPESQGSQKMGSNSGIG